MHSVTKISCHVKGFVPSSAVASSSGSGSNLVPTVVADGPDPTSIVSRVHSMPEPTGPPSKRSKHAAPYTKHSMHWQSDGSVIVQVGGCEVQAAQKPFDEYESVVPSGARKYRGAGR
jgi:hypothetical protein